MGAMDLQANPVNEILYVNFNQDFTCFICGTETGFRVYKTDPFRLTHRRDFEDGGGLGIVTMLFRTNIIAFSGGGQNPRFQPHKVMLWDDLQSKVIAQLGFRSSVKSVRMRRDLVVVALSSKVYVYAFRSLSLLDSIETASNPKGLCCLSGSTSERIVLVCPGMQQGSVLVVFYPRALSGGAGGAGGALAKAQPRERTTIISAHESPLASLSLDAAGGLLATASDKGTILRVFDTATGERMREFRRGADRAEIHSLSFSQHGEWLVVSSDKGTIHIFAISRQGGLQDQSSSNTTSSLKRLSKVLPAYFSSEWSLAQFRVADSRCIAAFGQDSHTVVVVCANGSYYKARFDPRRGGEMLREEFERFDDASTAALRGDSEIHSRADVPSAP